MNTRKPQPLMAAFWALLAAGSLGVSPAGGQVQEPLALSIELEKHEIALGEPVYLIVRLHNRGRGDVRLPNVLEPENGWLHVHVTGPAATRVTYVSLAQTDDETALPVSAGGTVANVVPIFYGTGGWTFPVPGAFELVATVSLPGRADPVQSAPVRLNVRPDPGGVHLMRTDRAGFEAARFLLWKSGDHLTAGRALLDSLSLAHPQSPLAQYAAFVEGRAASRRFNDFRAGRVRAAEPQRALTLLQRADDRVLPRSIRIQKQLAEASALIQLQRAEAARGRLAQARALIASDLAYAIFTPQVEVLERALGSRMEVPHDPEGRSDP